MFYARHLLPPAVFTFLTIIPILPGRGIVRGEAGCHRSGAGGHDGCV